MFLFKAILYCILSLICGMIFKDTSNMALFGSQIAFLIAAIINIHLWIRKL